MRRDLRIWLRESSAQQMRAEATRSAGLETGGVLMGYADDPDTIVITDVVGPGPRAIHLRTSFAPDLDYQERSIARVYKQSKRRTTYLGDWHSHPGGSSRLSSTDRRTLRRIRDHADARLPEPLMAVLYGRDPWTLAIWRLQRCTYRRGSRLRQGEVEEY